MSVDNNYYDEGYFLAVERKGNSEVIFCAPENSEYFANQMLRAQAPELPKGCRFMSKYEIKSDCLRTEVQELTEDQIADLDFATRADAEGYFYELSSHADAVLSTINEIENSDLLILTGLPDGMAATSPAAQNYKTLEDIVTAYAEWLPGHDTKVSKIKVYGITEVKKLRADFETNKLMRTLIDRLIPEHKHENTTAPRVTGWYVNEKELRDQEQGLGARRKIMEVNKALVLYEDASGNVEIQHVTTEQDYLNLADARLHRRHPELQARKYRRKEPKDFDVDSHLEDLGYTSDITCANDLTTIKESAEVAHQVAQRFFQTPEYYVPAVLNGMILDNHPPTEAEMKKYPGLVNYYTEEQVLDAIMSQEAENGAQAYYMYRNEKSYEAVLLKVITEYKGKNPGKVKEAVRKLTNRAQGNENC